MRENLFRGKRVGGGEWVYGDLRHDKDGRPHIVPKGQEFDFDDDMFEIYEVALAAMNDTNDYMQWFTDGRDWRLCPDIVVTKMAIPSYALYSKATAEEIIEHFKNK